MCLCKAIILRKSDLDVLELNQRGNIIGTNIEYLGRYSIFLESFSTFILFDSNSMFICKKFDLKKHPIEHCYLFVEAIVFIEQVQSLLRKLYINISSRRLFFTNENGFEFKIKTNNHIVL